MKEEEKSKKDSVLWITDFSVRRPVTIFMIYLGLLTLSFVALSRMGLDMFPDVSYPSISVVTEYQGAGAEEIEEKITKPIESQLSIVRNLDQIKSRSKEGTSSVQLRFKWGVNLDEAANDVRDRLGVIERVLPDEADDPVIYRFDLQDMPVVFIGARARESYAKLYTLLNKDVSDMLKRINGVGNVSINGGVERQVNVDVDRQKLESRGLTLSDIKTALTRNNLMTAAGDIKIGDVKFLLRVPGEFKTVAEIREVPVGFFQGNYVKMKDVAEVRDSRPEESDRVKINGELGAVMLIQKRSGANIVSVSDAILEALPGIEARLPKDVKLEVLMDNAQDVRRTLKNLSETLWIAVALIFCIILFFIRRMRPALIVFTSIPLSLIDSFMLQYAFGYTINMISLLAITIAVGLVVDDALVVMENQVRHQDEFGSSPKEAAVRATSQVGRAVTISTLTSCIVFLPLIFATGIAGVFFKQLAVVISFTLLVSLFDSLTLNPTLCSLFLKKGKEEQKKNHWFLNWSERQFQHLEKFYSDIIGWALDYRKTVLFLMILLFGGSMLVVPLVGTDFMPDQDDGKPGLSIELPVGTRVEVTHEVMDKIEAEFRKIVPREWVENIFWRDGVKKGGGRGGMHGKTGYNVGSFNAVLVEKQERTKSKNEILDMLRKNLKIPGITRMVPIDSHQMLTASGNQMVVNVYGFDLSKAYEYAEKIKTIMEDVEGLKDVRISQDMTNPEYHIYIDREKASTLGLSISEISDTINLAFAQQKSSVYRESGDEYDIVIRLREEDRKSETDLDSLFVKSPQGALIRLSNVARFEKSTGPVQIEREDQQRLIRVQSNVSGRDLGSITRELDEKLQKIPFPFGISYGFSGAVQDQKESFQSLGLAVILGIFLVYMVMAAQFESFMIPLIIMFSIPFGFVGAVWVFAATGFSLNMSTFIGLILMIGLVVKQAIVYLDYAIQLKDTHADIRYCLMEAGRVRLRPILMTVSAMVLGMLPLALSTKQGNEFWQPLALSVIGGLIMSTLVTLVLIPTLYSMWEGRKSSSKN